MSVFQDYEMVADVDILNVDGGVKRSADAASEKTTRKKPTIPIVTAGQIHATDEAILAVCDGDRNLLFYSKSKAPIAKYISNSQLLSKGLEIPPTYPVRGMVGWAFPTIEHAFQATKIYLSGGEDLARTLSSPSGDGMDALAVKRAGGRAAFKATNITLDFGQWNSISPSVMRSLVHARSAVDPEYARILAATVRLGISLRHFERSGEKSIWGGHFRKGDGMWVGQNRLGSIMTSVGGFLLPVQ